MVIKLADTTTPIAAKKQANLNLVNEQVNCNQRLPQNRSSPPLPLSFEEDDRSENQLPNCIADNPLAQLNACATDLHQKEKRGANVLNNDPKYAFVTVDINASSPQLPHTKSTSVKMVSTISNYRSENMSDICSRASHSLIERRSISGIIPRLKQNQPSSRSLSESSALT